MKPTLLAAAFAAALAAAQPPSLTGTWRILRSASGNESTHTCTLQQKDTALSGSCSSSDQTVTITGKVDGSKVEMTYKTERDGSPHTVKYSGAIQSPDKFAGAVVAVEMGIEGEFTATREK